MYLNYWLDRSMAVVESEILLGAGRNNSLSTKELFDMVPSHILAIYPEKKILGPDDFGPKVGYVHHVRLTRLGVEGILKAPRKYHRYSYYVYHDRAGYSSESFWVVLEK